VAKRKMSIFERLRNGERLNRQQRKELQQQLNAADPSAGHAFGCSGHGCGE
jgi:hypothetical protein